MNRKAPKAVSRAPHRVWLLAVLVLVGVGAYWNSFGVPLVFDDLLTVQRNTGVRFGEFDWNLLSARSVLYLTFTLNSIWGGQEVWGYHLVNLLLHLLNGILLFFVAERVFAQVGADEPTARMSALLAATFFVVHPVQTESVTYISSRSELLSTVFYLSGFLLFVLWPLRRIGFLFSLLVVVPFFFGLGAKETVITLPAAIFLYDFVFLSKGDFRPLLSRWRFYITFVIGAVAATYYILTVALQGTVGPNTTGNLPVVHYFLTQLRVLVRYVYLVFFPVGLNLDYDFPPSTSPLEPAVIASFLFLTALFVCAWLIRKRQPVVSFSIFWFFITLAPTSSVVPILDVIFEHRLYLPLVGICLSFPVFVSAVANAARNRLQFQLNARITAAVLLAVLMIGTIMRNSVWGDEVRLYQDVVSKSPKKDRAVNGLVFSLFKKARYDEAIVVLNRAIEANPEMRLNFGESLGNLYLKTGRFDEASEVFKEMIPQTEGPRLAMTYNNLGVSYLYKWQTVRARQNQLSTITFAEERARILEPAVEAFQKSVETDESMFTALDSFINASIDLGRQEQLQAEALARLANGEDFNGLYTVGKIAFLRNDFATADQFFERAEKVKSTEKLVYFNHGFALDALNQKDRAVEKYLRAIRIDPIFTEAHHNVGLIYMDRRQFTEAINHFSEMLRYDPNHVQSNLNLAKIYAYQGDKAAARRFLTTVLNVSPGNEMAIRTWQQLGL